MENKKPTQCDRIIQYIEDFGSITQMEALIDLGIMRLAARISEMRSKGYKIKTEFIHSKNRYGEHMKYAKYSFEVIDNG